MKSTTAGQAGSRNNGPALTHFTRLWRTAFRTMAVPEMVYRVAARRVDSRSRRGSLSLSFSGTKCDRFESLDTADLRVVRKKPARTVAAMRWG
jgi:hypothetical protein